MERQNEQGFLDALTRTFASLQIALLNDMVTSRRDPMILANVCCKTDGQLVTSRWYHGTKIEQIA
jgi:hypothetical protein